VKRLFDEFAGGLDLSARLAEHGFSDRLEDAFRDAHLDVAFEKCHLEVPQRLLEVFFFDDDPAGRERLRALERARIGSAVVAARVTRLV